MEFKYLNNDTKELSEVAFKYFKKDIYNKFIVLTSYLVYKVFNNPNEYLNYYNENIDKIKNGKLILHEVILMDKPFKMFFDIDKVIDLEVNTNDTKESILMQFYEYKKNYKKEIIDAIVNEFNDIYFKNIKIDKLIQSGKLIRQIDKNDLLFLDSSSNKESIIFNNKIKNIKCKISFHIIIKNHLILNYIEALEFARRIKEYYEIDGIDLEVYKINHALRLVNTIKDGRKKKTPKGVDFTDCLIKPYGNLDNYTILFSIIDDIKNDIENDIDFNGCENYSKIKKIIPKNILKDFKFSKFKNGTYNFLRKNASYCDICDRTHDNDNTFLVIQYNNGNVYRSCWRDRSKNIYLGNINIIDENDNNKDNNNIKKITKQNNNILHELFDDNNKTTDNNNKVINNNNDKAINNDKTINNNDKIINNNNKIINNNNDKINSIIKKPIALLKDNDLKKLSKSSLQYKILNTVLNPKKESISKFANHNLINDKNNMIKSYELLFAENNDPNVLLIKAGMGMGKTKELKKYLQLDQNKNKIMIYISFRKAFSSDIKNNFSELNFKSYRDINGAISLQKYKKIIIQIESLSRLDLNTIDNTDIILILDEIETIWMQFISGMIKDLNITMPIFNYLVKFANKIIAIDANLSNKTCNLLQKYRPDDKFLIYHNTNINKKNKSYQFAITEEQFINKLTSLISEQHQKIAIFTNSMKKGRQIKKYIKSIRTDYKIKFYSSKTEQSIKDIHFSNVDKYWSQYDIIICTPTVSAGVSFELEHFNYVFGYFTESSCEVETCLQMIGRIRNVNSYIIFINDKNGNIINDIGDDKKFIFPTKIKYIEEQLMKNREVLNNSSLIYELDEDLKPLFYKNYYYYIWLENMKTRNLSKNYFVERFISYLIYNGNKNIKILNFKIKDNHIYNNFRIFDKQNIMKDCKKISLAKDLSEEEHNELKNKLSYQLDITKEDRYCLEKYKIRQIYYNDTDNNNIIFDEKFIKKFNNLKTIQQFKNLKESIDMIYTNNDINIKTLLTNNNENNNLLINDNINISKQINIHNKFVKAEDIYSDLSYNYTAQKHIICHKLINLLSFNSIWDNSKKLLHNIDLEKVNNYITDDICYCFEIKKLNFNTIELVNNILYKFYGIKIAQKDLIIYINRLKFDKLYT